MPDKQPESEGEHIPSDVLVVPQDLTGPGVNTTSGFTDEKVTPQELTSPGTQPDFRAPQGFVPTQVVRPRKGSISSSDGPSKPIDAQRALLQELHESRRFFRRAAAASAIVASLASVGVVVMAVMLQRTSAELRELRQDLAESRRIGAESRPQPAEQVERTVERHAEPARDRTEGVIERPKVEEPVRAEESRPHRTEEPKSKPKSIAKEEPKRMEPLPEEPKKGAEPKAAPEPKGPHAGLARLLGKLRANPNDGATFDELAKGLKEATRNLPEERRRGVLSAVNAAELSYNVDGLAKALDLLSAQ